MSATTKFCWLRTTYATHRFPARKHYHGCWKWQWYGLKYEARGRQFSSNTILPRHFMTSANSMVFPRKLLNSLIFPGRFPDTSSPWPALFLIHKHSSSHQLTDVRLRLANPGCGWPSCIISPYTATGSSTTEPQLFTKMAPNLHFISLAHLLLNAC